MFPTLALLLVTADLLPCYCSPLQHAPATSAVVGGSIVLTCSIVRASDLTEDDPCIYASNILSVEESCKRSSPACSLWHIVSKNVTLGVYGTSFWWYKFYAVIQWGFLKRESIKQENCMHSSQICCSLKCINIIHKECLNHCMALFMLPFVCHACIQELCFCDTSSIHW